MRTYNYVPSFVCTILFLYKKWLNITTSWHIFMLAALPVKPKVENLSNQTKIFAFYAGS